MNLILEKLQARRSARLQATPVELSNHQPVAPHDGYTLPWHDCPNVPGIETSLVPRKLVPAAPVSASSLASLASVTPSQQLITLPAPVATVPCGLGEHHPMRFIFLDAETYFDAGYSLKKLDMASYLMDERFELLGFASLDSADGSDAEPVWRDGECAIDWLRSQPLGEVAFVMHNAAFDGALLSYRYGISPALYVDTMSMARGIIKPQLGNKGSVSLANVASHLGLGAKGTELANFMGLRLPDIKIRGLYEGFKNYALQDVRLCSGVFAMLAPILPTAEYDIIHDTIRMVTEPLFEIDAPLLVAHLKELEQHKAELLARSGVDRSELMSNERFALALKNLGVDPPRKISKTNGKETWAFSKNDAGFQALLEHPDEAVRELTEARMGSKSTLEASRIKRFIQTASTLGRMPVELAYCGAHTGRYSGAGGANLQNLPSRGNTTLRKSLKAPHGHMVIAVDAAQIEARLSAWLGGEKALLSQFEKGEDIYSAFASKLYNRSVTKQDKQLRWVGKTAVLALQFGQGAQSFMNVANVQAKAQGIDMSLTLEEAQRIVTLYRRTYKGIVGAWKRLDGLLRLMVVDGADGMTFGPCVVDGRSFILPNGMRVNYHRLRYAGMELVYDFGGATKKLYHAKCLENLVQALDRIVVMEAWLRIKARAPYARLVNQLHDELLLIAPSDFADEYKSVALEEMRCRPKWATDLPLNGEAHTADNFGDCK